MKKVLASGLALLTFLTYTATTYAISGTAWSPCAGDNANIVGNIICKINVENPGGVIGAIISFVLFLAVFIAFVFLVIGGLKWITSGGDKSAVESARNTIIAAIIGLVIAFLAYLIINIVLGLLGLSFSTLVLPQLPS